LITDGTHERSNYIDDGIPLLRVQNVLEDGILLNDLVYITEEEHNKLRRTALKPKDVLLTKDGRIGTSTVFPEGIGEANLSAHVARIVLKDGVNPYYVSTFLNSYFGQVQIERKTKGIGSRGISLSQIKSIKIPIPPRKIQDKIAATMREAYKRRKEKLREADEIISQAREEVEKMILGDLQ
jgi:restriction endonuclease S subunit